MQNSLKLLLLQVLISLTPQLSAGSCMSTPGNKVSPTHISTPPHSPTFVTVVTPGTDLKKRRNSNESIEKFAQVIGVTARMTSSSTESLDDDGYDIPERPQSSEEEKSIQGFGIDFKDFKKLWIDFRYSLVSLRGRLHEFRKFYTTLCNIETEKAGIFEDYSHNCALRHSTSFKRTRIDWDKTTTEQAYTQAKNHFEEAITIASTTLLMGKTALPAAGFPPAFKYPKTDISPLRMLVAPDCPWCKADARARGIHAGTHKNFDADSHIFYDTCPDCKKSFLKSLYKKKTNFFYQLRSAISHYQQATKLLWCIYPKALWI